MVTMERWVTIYLLSFEKELVRYGAQDQEKSLLIHTKETLCCGNSCKWNMSSQSL